MSNLLVKLYRVVFDGQVRFFWLFSSVNIPELVAVTVSSVPAPGPAALAQQMSRCESGTQPHVRGNYLAFTSAAFTAQRA